MFSRFSRLNANGDVEIRFGCRSTVFVYRFYADACADEQTLVGLRSKTSLDSREGADEMEVHFEPGWKRPKPSASDAPHERP
jgi:hypothetical protein